MKVINLILKRLDLPVNNYKICRFEFLDDNGAVTKIGVGNQKIAYSVIEQIVSGNFPETYWGWVVISYRIGYQIHTVSIPIIKDYMVSALWKKDR